MVGNGATHRQVSVNGIELHVAEQGEGRPVILAHGFPELWYSWRHQLPALAAAGYRVLAPDMRGYGRSSIPADVDAYDLATVGADLLGLLDDLGEDKGVFIGHDWGAAAVWHLARAHPGRVAGVVGMSVPFFPGTPTVAAMREAFGEHFYIVRFQEPGVADAELAGDTRRALAGAWAPNWDGGVDHVAEGPPGPLPAWMDESDADVYVDSFERTGFTGGLNYYRNIDRNSELTEPLKERRIERPALFLTGARDPVRRWMPA